MTEEQKEIEDLKYKIQVMSEYISQNTNRLVDDLERKDGIIRELIEETEKLRKRNNQRISELEVENSKLRIALREESWSEGIDRALNGTKRSGF